MVMMLERTWNVARARGTWACVACVIAGCGREPAPPAAFVPVEPGFEAVQRDLFGAGGGQPLAAADYDGDGDPDVFVGFTNIPNRLYRNNGDGTFADVAAEAGIADLADTRAAAWGDYDKDGHPDLYLGPAREPNLLYHNNGDGTFTEVAASVGMTALGSIRQPSWVDFDNDGDLDLHVAMRAGPNLLYRNDGGRFRDVAAAMGVADPRKTVGVVWFDFNQDGRLDVVLANQDGDVNGFYRNDGSRFVDIADSLGMKGAGDPGREGGVAPVLNDYNNDGLLDVMFINRGPNGFFENQGDGTFKNVAAERGIQGNFPAGGEGVAGVWGDYDNNGFEDLYVVGFQGGHLDFPDALFKNNGGTGFTDVIPAHLAQHNGDHGLQWIDVDQNGSLDLWMASNDSAGVHYLYRNTLPPEIAQRSIKVDVQDLAGHHTPGAEVRLFSSADGRLLGTRVVDTGSGYVSQNMGPVHFGLGNQEGPVDVEVTYMTATGRATTRVEDVDPTQYRGARLLVVRPGG